MMKIKTGLIALALLALFGCQSSTRVGDDSLLKFKDKPQERLGNQKSPTPTEESTVSPPPKQVIAAPSPTEKPKEVQATFKISINSDTSSVPGFNPSVSRVFLGTAVTWTNTDSVARSIQADEGAFNSPSIPPGGSWTYNASNAGRFNYHDGTRPYTVGSLEVVARS